MAGHSIWGRLIIQKPETKHKSKLDDLRAGFEIAEAYWIGHSKMAKPLIDAR